MNAQLQPSTSPRYFSNDDFAYNPDLKPNLLEFGGRQLMFFDNVFAHPDRVVAYLNQITAFKSHKTAPHSRNGIDFLDGQHVVSVGEDRHRDRVEGLIAAHYGIAFTPRKRLLFNQFKLLRPPPRGAHWWPHTDRQINQITFLNPSHNGKDGTSIYRCRRPIPAHENEHEHPWRATDEFEEVLCVRDNFNMMFAMPGNWYHGMRISDDTFLSNVRYTEVRFSERGAFLRASPLRPKGLTRRCRMARRHRLCGRSLLGQIASATDRLRIRPSAAWDPGRAGIFDDEVICAVVVAAG